MSTKERYYQVLGITEAAGISQLKRAYHRKAKVLHPDVNPSPNAHEEFILLNEAFDYVKLVLTGKIYHPRTKKYHQRKSTKPKSSHWKDEQRQNARTRAREQAKMEYQEYLKSDEYKQYVALDTVVDALIWLTLFAVVILTPIGLLPFRNRFTFFLGFVILFASIPFWLPRVPVRGHNIDHRQLISAIKTLWKAPRVAIVAPTFFNFLVLVNLTVDLPIPFWASLIGYGLCGWLLQFQNKIKVSNDLLIRYGIQGISTYSCLVVIFSLAAWLMGY